MIHMKFIENIKFVQNPLPTTFITVNNTYVLLKCIVSCIRHFEVRLHRMKLFYTHNLWIVIACKNMIDFWLNYKKLS
jgi:hypothetical protein